MELCFANVADTFRVSLPTNEHKNYYAYVYVHVTILGIIIALHPTVKQHKTTENLPHVTFPFATALCLTRNHGNGFPYLPALVGKFNMAAVIDR